MTDFFLTTSRLGFRHWRRDDEDLAVDLWGDLNVARYIFKEPPPSREAIVARLHREIECQELHGIQYWPLFLLATNEHVGCAGLRPYKVDQRIYEFGVHLRSAHWRNGYANEAAQAVISYGLDTLKAMALFAGHHPANTASALMLTKLRFRYTHDELYAPTGLMHPSYLLDHCDARPSERQ